MGKNIFPKSSNKAVQFKAHTRFTRFKCDAKMRMACVCVCVCAWEGTKELMQAELADSVFCFVRRPRV